eukprot:scaffold48791_cov59-Phaeocystis_antarctica.AAC.9
MRLPHALAGPAMHIARDDASKSLRRLSELRGGGLPGPRGVYGTHGVQSTVSSDPPRPSSPHDAPTHQPCRALTPLRCRKDGAPRVTLTSLLARGRGVVL